MATFCDAFSAPSLTVNETEYEPAILYVGVHTNVFVAGSKDAPVGKLEAAKVSSLPSGSLPFIWKLNAAASLTVCAATASRTGARLTLATVIVVCSVALRLPSVTVKVTV